MRLLSSKGAAFSLLPVVVGAVVVAALPSANAGDHDSDRAATSLPRPLPPGVKPTGPRSSGANATTLDAFELTAADVHATARARAWDINGDGYAELVVGSPGEDVGSVADAGGFHVFKGSSGGVTASGSKFYTQNTTGIPGTSEAGDVMGEVFASDDFNGDGKADVAVSVTGENGNGRVYVFYGSSTGLKLSSVTVLSNKTDVEGAFGYSLAAGDFNADGYGDLLATDPANPVMKGFPGGPAGLSQDTGGNFTPGTSIETGFGMSMAAGDINGDGKDDVVIGEPFADTEGLGYPSGSIWALYGGGAAATQIFSKSTDGIEGDPSAPGDNDNPDLFGLAVAIGDFDHDGYGDVAAGAPGSPVTYTSNGSPVTAEDAGTVNTIYGTSTGLVTTGNESLDEATTGVPGVPRDYDLLGLTLAAADANHDGDAELAAHSLGENSVIVIEGTSSTGLAPVVAKAWSQNTSGIPGATEAEDAWGVCLRFASYRGGSYPGLAIGAPGENNGAGAVTVLKSTSTGLTATSAVAYSQNSSYVPGTSEAGDVFGTFY